MKNILRIIRSKITVAKLNLTLVAVLVAFVVYTLFAPITPAVYGKPMVQDSNNLYAGHTLTYKIHSCRKVGDSVLTTITRQLVPVGQTTLQPINLSTDILSAPARCQDNTKTLLIPYSVPEGKYKLLIRGVYAIIPLRKPITVTAQSDQIFIHSTTVTQEIQDLIDANNLLQGQLSKQVVPINGSTTATTQNKNGSSTTSTNTNTTTTSGGSGSTNPKAPTEPIAPDPVQSGLIQNIIKALGGGISLQL